MEPQPPSYSEDPYAPAPGYGAPPPRDIRAAASAAQTSLICGILGLVVCAVLGIIAIVQGNKAKAVLQPGDPGYGAAQAGLVLGWIAVALWALGLVILLATGTLAGILGASGY